MVNLFHNFNLSFYTFSSVGFEKLELFVNLYSNLLIQQLMKSNSDDSICTLSYSLTDDIVIYVFDCAAICTELILLTIDSCWILSIFAIFINLIS